ncbi:MAG: hypothetical protein ACI4U4_03745 [Bacilli bacterium]
MDKEFFVKNKKKIIIVIVILAVALIGFSLVNSTYSLFYHEETASNAESYSTGLLSIVASSKGETISLNNTLPISDTDGINTTPYTFTIKNIGNLDYKFNVKLLSTSSSDTTIDPQYIKIKIDDGDVTTLSSLTNSIIKSDITLAAGESIDISIRVWLSIDTPNSQIGKVFNSKIVTDGQAVYTSTNNEVTTGAAFINSLFTPNTTVTNNNIEYRYDTSNNLMEDVGGNVRYYGAEPSNYIYFNCSDYSNQSSDTCETWRIIGVFDGKLKIMRNGRIGNYAWDNKDATTGALDNQGDNDWTDARLMKLLNPGYESETTGGSLYYNSEGGSCYVGPSNASTSCNFATTGIKNDATRNLISDTLYYLGGWDDTEVYSDQIYEYERGEMVYEGDPTTWTGKIALAYPSDYGYAADLGSCTQTLNYYNDTTCISVNWMINIIMESAGCWLLTSKTVEHGVVWAVDVYGNVLNYIYPYYDAGVVPVLYLDSGLRIGLGTGTSSDPYRLVI